MTSRRCQQLTGALTRAFSERQFDSPSVATGSDTNNGSSRAFPRLQTADLSAPPSAFQTSSGAVTSLRQQDIVVLGGSQPTSKDFRQADVVVHVGTGSRVMRRALVHPDDEAERHLSRKSHSASPMTSSAVCQQTGNGRDVSRTDSIGLKTPPPFSSSSFSPTYNRTNSANLSIHSDSVYRTPSGGTCSSITNTTTYRSSIDDRSILSDRQLHQPTPKESTTTHLVRSAFGQKSIKKMENRSDSEPRTRAELTRYRRIDADTVPLMPAVVSLDESAFIVPPLDLATSLNAVSQSMNGRSLSSAVADQFHMESLTGVGRHVVYNPRANPANRTLQACGVGDVDEQTKFGIRRRQTRLRINVSGQHFEIGRCALARHPTTLLGNGERRRRYYDSERDELFLDRHRPSFEAIFAYYQTGGRVRRPYNVPDDVFLAELTFYQLEPEVVEEYKRYEGYVVEQLMMPDNRWMRRVWMLFEYPDTSRWAFCIAVVSVIITLVSIILFCVETLPSFATSHCVTDDAPNFADPFFVIETVCTAWFTIEAIVRFIVCPSKLRFWKDFKNIVDVTAVVPYYVTLFNVLSTMSCASAKSSASLSFLRVIRLVRIFKLTKHSVGLQILVMTFKASLEGLGLFLVALFVSLLVFSSAIYYAELGLPKTQMYSIPDAFWWAIITMTTVGYGDKVPVGPIGRLIGAACAITGVLTLAIPVPIITGHFNRFYSHKTGRGRHM
jgi:hypothetical protein